MASFLKHMNAIHASCLCLVD